MIEINTSCLVWDFDGTLLDSFGLKETVLCEVLERRGLPAPPHEAFVHNHYGQLRDTIQNICGIVGLELDDIVEDFMQSEEHHYEHPEGLYFPDALDLLQRSHFANLRNIITSNRFHRSDRWPGSPRNLARRPPLAGMIQAVVCGDDNDFHKPDPRVLNEAERTLGVLRTDLTVIGDQFVDAELARNLGAAAVLIARGGETVPHLNRLSAGWQDYVQIVDDLRTVSIRPAGVQAAGTLDF